MKKQARKALIKEMNRDSWRSALRAYNRAVDRYNHAVMEVEFWEGEMKFLFDDYNNHVRLIIPQNKQAKHLLPVCGKKVSFNENRD